jgi:hypothetical protein
MKLLPTHPDFFLCTYLKGQAATGHFDDLGQLNRSVLLLAQVPIWRW